MKTDSAVAIDEKYLHKDERYFAHARPEMVKMLPKNAKTMLDVGCSTGQFGKLAKETLPNLKEVWGIELHRESAMQAEDFLDRVIVGGAPEALEPVPDHYFDCVVFNDVLEHLADPEEVLSIVKTKLRPNGYVVASIPNIREFQTLSKLIFQGTWEYQDSGILDRTHLRFFTESSIKNMFGRLGFTMEEMKGINRNWRRLPRFLNLVTFGLISDTLFLQFAVRAKV